MKNIIPLKSISLTIVCLMATNLFAQDIVTRVDSLKTEFLKTKATLNSTDVTKDHQTISKIITSAVTDASKSLQLIPIYSKLATTQKNFLNAQNDYQKLGEEISAQFVATPTNSPVYTEISQLNEEVKATGDRVVEDNAIMFRSYTVSWNHLAAQMAASAQTMENILIFPEDGAKASNFLLKIGQYAGIAGGLIGASIAQKNASSGITTSAASLSVTAFLTTLIKDKKAKGIVQNLARNAAFTDEIKAYNILANDFSKSCQELSTMIGARAFTPGWKPTKTEVAKYYSVLALSRDFNTITRQMRAKAQTLISLGPEQDEVTKLEQQIKKYDLALIVWQNSEAVYMSTYDVLNNANLKAE